MEFKILVEELQNIFTRLSYVIKMNDNEIPGMVFVEADTDKTVFKASDGSVNLSVEASGCEIIEPGKAMFRFRDLRGYVMKFTPLMDNYGTKDFHFSITDSEGILKTKTLFPSNKPSYRKLSFLSFESSIFPKVKSFDEAQLIINGNVLKAGIDRVTHCIDPSNIIAALTGIYMTIYNDKIVFAGSNGIKLSEISVDMNADIDKKSYILRYNFASVLRSCLDSDAQVFMKFDGNNVYAKFNKVYIIGNIIVNDKYPDYKHLFTMGHYVDLPRLDFIDTIRTVMEVLDPEDNNRLTVRVEGNKLILKNKKTESVQELPNSLDCDLDIDVNGLFLESLLKDFREDLIRVEFEIGVNRLIFKSPIDNNHTALITGVRRR